MDEIVRDKDGEKSDKDGGKWDKDRGNIERIGKILQNLVGKIPKGDDVAQGYQEDKDSVHVEKPSFNKNTPRGSDSNNISNRWWPPRGLQLPNIDMRKFEVNGPITWIFQMEKFFDMHQVSNLQKVTISSLYLETQQFVWYKWPCEHKNNTIISRSIFIEELILYHDDVKRNSLFTQLINLRQKGSVIEYIQQFQKLSIRVDDILDDKLLDLFIGNLKNNIEHEVSLFEPTYLENDFMVERKVQRKFMAMATRRITSNTYRENNVPSSNQLKPTRLTPQQMDEK